MATIQIGALALAAYSRRDHWPSARIPDGADYSMAGHVHDLHAVLDALDVARAHLVGIRTALSRVTLAVADVALGATPFAY